MVLQKTIVPPDGPKKSSQKEPYLMASQKGTVIQDSEQTPPLSEVLFVLPSSPSWEATLKSLDDPKGSPPHLSPGDSYFVSHSIQTQNYIKSDLNIQVEESMHQ